MAQIEARDAEETDRRRLLSSPTESADFDPSSRTSPGGAAAASASTVPVDAPEAWNRGDPSKTYPYKSPASRESNNDPYAYTPPRPQPQHTTPRDTYDPNAPIDNDLRAKSQRETELARRRMEVSKSPLSGFVPIDPGHSERAGRVGSDSIKGDERRGDVDAQTDPGSVVPRPRRRGPATSDNKGAHESTSTPIDLDALAARGRVDATRKSEVQDVQAGSDQDIREKAKELERRKDEQ